MTNIPAITLFLSNGSIDVAPQVYPDNTPFVSVGNCDDVMAMLVRPVTFTDFMSAMFLADSISERTGRAIALVLPSIPGARQDRINHAGDFLFTAKSVAREINMREFSSVTVLDPHSEVAPALINRCKVFRAHDVGGIVARLAKGNYNAVVSPDAGAEKRAAGIAKKLGIPLIHGWKNRDVSTGLISGFGCEDCVSNYTGRILIADDLCDGGGTFMGLRSFLTTRTAATCDLFVTHGLFSKGTLNLLKIFKNVICTDSMPQAKTSGAEIIEVCYEL